MNKQKGFSAVEIVMVVVIIALVGAIGYLVFKAQTNKATDKTAPTTTEPAVQEVAGPTVIEESSYKITLPAGWAESPSAPNSYVGELGNGFKSTGSVEYYKDQNGNYVMVQLDPLGRGFEANETWTLANTATGFEFASKTTCTAGADFCTPADANEYRVGIKTEGARNGYEYFFFAGNSANKTNVNTDVFKQIVESVVIK